MKARENEIENARKDSNSKRKQTIDLSKIYDKDFEKYLFPLVQVMFPANELMQWKEPYDTKPPPNSTGPTKITKCCHHELWDCVINHLNPG